MRLASAPGTLAALALLAAFAVRAQAEVPSMAELEQRFSGEYRFVGGEAEKKAVPAAVERSVDGMFFISRGIAYDRLLRVCEVCSSYRLSFTGGVVDVRSPCQLADQSPDDGRAVDHTTKDGDTSKLSQRFIDGTLQQDFVGEGGSRRVVWTLTPDGEGLRVHITITSKHLPNAVDYSLSYRRASAAAASSPAVGPRDAGPPGG
jgi:hypothetical protein